MSTNNSKNTADESRYRSLFKAISWRITGTVDTILISFLLTGKAKLAFSIGLVECFTKIVLYYLHERAWNLFSFGRPKTDSAHQARGKEAPRERSLDLKT